MTAGRQALLLLVAALAWPVDWLQQQLSQGILMLLLEAVCLDAELTRCMVLAYAASGVVVASFVLTPTWLALVLLGRIAAARATCAWLRRAVLVLGVGFVLGAVAAGLTARMVPSTNSALFWPWVHLAAITANLALAGWALAAIRESAS